MVCINKGGEKVIEGLLIMSGIIFLIYKVAFGIPNQINNLESRVDTLHLQLKEIQIKLNQMDKKLDEK